MSTIDTARGEVLRAVPDDVRTTTQIGAFAKAAERATGHVLPDYEALWEWSVADLDGFWRLLCEHYGVKWHEAPSAYLPVPQMPGTEWCPGGTLNYAEHCLTHRGDQPAIISLSQSRTPITLSRDDLLEQVERCATGLRRLGVTRGSTVAGYVPDIAEAMVAFLATASLGATWASCAPEFGPRSVIDRLAQIAPDVLIVIDGYRFGDRHLDRGEEIRAIRAALPGLRHTVALPYLEGATPVPDAVAWADLLSEREPLTFEPVPFAHPLYVLFSSGTTGLPKPIVHGHGGILLEHLKVMTLALDLDEDDVFFWFSTTGWMVWNLQVSALLSAAAVLCFDGDPAYPDLDNLWRVAAEHKVTAFGASAAFISGCRKAGLVPKDTHDLSALHTLVSSGSPLPAEGYRWAYEAVGDHILLNSISGGTDVCSAFVGCTPMQPVRAGEISGSLPGVRVAAFDEAGGPVIGEKGELVLTTPMPSMPVAFLGDEDGSRLREAYFDHFPGVWRHGDWITVYEDGACVISGRSDATLNRGGVRLGTAEFYAVVEDIPVVADSLVVHLEDAEGGSGRLILFVALAEDGADIEALRSKIASELRARLSPRHVPDELHVVPGVPRTLSGKKLEVPVKRILTGTPVDVAASRGALANPDVLGAYEDIAAGIAPSPPPPPLSVEFDGPLALVTLDAPPANALTLAMTAALSEALDMIEASGARVAIFRSAVPGFFVAGADLKLLGAADTAVFADYMARLRGTIERIPKLDAITIAAVDGHTLGGGFELAAACTFRVGGPGAKLGVPEIKLGLLPGAGGTQRLPRLTTRGSALDLLLTGRSADAEEALRMGLIDRLDASGAEAGAQRLAGELLRMPASAMTAIVRCVDAARDLPLERGLDVEGEEIVTLFAGADAREGLTAFLEKRRPDFG